MNTTDHTLYLKEVLLQMKESLEWLRHSYEICKKIGLKEEYSAEEYDAIETLTSRYARSTDLIIHKVFKTIDKMEIEESGTILDVVNRAEKRNLIDSVEKIRLMKDLRNVIVHEYVSRVVIDVFQDVLEYTPNLFTMGEKIKIYCQKFDNE